MPSVLSGGISEPPYPRLWRRSLLWFIRTMGVGKRIAKPAPNDPIHTPCSGLYVGVGFVRRYHLYVAFFCASVVLRFLMHAVVVKVLRRSMSPVTDGLTEPGVRLLSGMGYRPFRPTWQLPSFRVVTLGDDLAAF